MERNKAFFVAHMSPEHGPFQQEKYSSNHHFSGVMLQGGPRLVWNGVKTALNGQKQVGNWGYFTPISGVMGPLLIAGDGVYLVVFEVSGETEGAESKAVGPTVGFRTSEGSEASWRAHLKNWPTSLLDVKLAKFETWDKYILERNIWRYAKKHFKSNTYMKIKIGLELLRLIRCVILPLSFFLFYRSQFWNPVFNFGIEWYDESVDLFNSFFTGSLGNVCFFVGIN